MQSKLTDFVSKVLKLSPNAMRRLQIGLIFFDRIQMALSAPKDRPLGS